MSPLMKKLAVVVPLAAAAVLAGRFLMLKKQEVSRQPVPNPPSLAIELTRAEKGTLPQIAHFLAQVDALESVNVASKLSGYVEAVYVREGDAVAPGTQLALIDDTEIRQSIRSVESSKAALQSELELKRAIHARNVKLHDIEALPREQLDASAVAVDALQSRMETLDTQAASLRNQLQYLHLDAPFAGNVAEVAAHQGDLAVPNRPIVKLNSLEKKLTFQFSSKEVRSGREVYHDGRKIGRIERIYDDAKNGLRVAEASLSVPVDYKPGETMLVDVLVREAEGCTVDSRAVLYRDGKTYLLARENAAFTPREVSVFFGNDVRVLIEPCIDAPVALGSQTKLAELPQYRSVTIVGTEHEDVR